MAKMNKAVFLTGAAARISQEVALFDKLVEQKGLKVSQDDTIVAGFSSGSLNLLAINSCFRNESPLSWKEDYLEGTLYPLKDEDVYVKNNSGGLHIFDTTPLRKTLDTFIEKSRDKLPSKEFNWVRDFAFESYVITFSDRKFHTKWATNIAGEQDNLFLSDLFMASTAIPVVFPWQEISNEEGQERNFPYGHFSDGGTGGTFKKFEEYFGEYLKKQGTIEDMYIISPMRESGTDEAQESILEALKDHELKSDLKTKLGDFASSISFGTFFKFLQALLSWNNEHQLIGNIYVNIPRMGNNFGILDFTKEKEQYDAVCKWVEDNPDDFCVKLDKFIDTHV